MICPKCRFEQDDRNIECPRCGIIFKRYRQAVESDRKEKKSQHDEDPLVSDSGGIISELLFSIKPEINPIFFFGRVVIFIAIFIWGWAFILHSPETNYSGSSFLHLVNLPFHEAGHIIFRPFGRIITSLGGTLGQLLMPVVCLLVLLLATRDPFGASICLWWLGENFMDIAPYINDARSLSLPLLGGNTGKTSPYGFHDWEFILNEVGILRYDHLIANISYYIGILLIIASFAWGVYLLFLQLKEIRHGKKGY
jgi:hypothetical protein